MSAAVVPQPSTPTPASTEAGVGVVLFKNGQDWHDAIGNVSLERVVFDPIPGLATEADVLRLDAQDRRHCELVHGTLVEKAVGAIESAVAFRIAFYLGLIIIPQKLGVALITDGTIRLIRRQIRMPDVAYYPYARLPNNKMPKAAIPTIVPDLAVEVISEGNTSREMSIKLGEYFEAGTRLVWYVYPKTKTIDVYTSPSDPVTLAGLDRLTAGEVVPGFDIAVADVFDIDIADGE